MPERSIVTTTSRLRVTTWTSDDLADLHRLHCDPEVMRYMTSGVEDLDQTRARLDTFLAEQASPGWTKWRVEDQAGRLVGRAGFRAPHAAGHRELGYVLARELWGAGHATELAVALVRWHDLHPAPDLGRRALAYVLADHTVSRMVLSKAGFRFVGVDSTNPCQWIYESVHREQDEHRCSLTGAAPARGYASDG